MPVVFGKVHGEYHDPVGNCKAMDSTTAGCSCKFGCIQIFSKTFDIEGKILIGR